MCVCVCVCWRRDFEMKVDIDKPEAGESRRKREGASRMGGRVPPRYARKIPKIPHFHNPIQPPCPVEAQ